MARPADAGLRSYYIICAEFTLRTWPGSETWQEKKICSVLLFLFLIFVIKFRCCHNP